MSRICAWKFMRVKDGDILEYRHGYLKDANPELYGELDLEKNKDIDINQLSATSGKRVWWRCSICGHEWEAIINSRTKGHGCPKYIKHPSQGQLSFEEFK